MKILGIETSCDETAVSIVDDKKNILSNLILSQIDLHQEFGGVVPELAARSHAETLDKLIKKSLTETKLSFSDLDGIAATAGPGLIGGVIVGLIAAKTIASVCKKPFIAVNHLEAHSLTVRLTNDNIEFPYLLLLASGGHCQILVVKGVGKYQLIGKTIDDAAGEAFDKVAQMLNLGYPGGPKIEEIAKNGNKNRFRFPKPLIKELEHQFNFSFSGLKTSVRNCIEKNINNEENSSLDGRKEIIADIAASFQKTVADVIIDRLKNAVKFTQKNNIPITNIVIAGGVAANQYIKGRISTEFTDFNVVSPPIKLCTDNAAMVAWVGVEKMQLGISNNLNFKPKSRWNLD